jgi:hypothetical protein
MGAGEDRRLAKRCRQVHRPASFEIQTLETDMKKISALVLAASLASTAAFAGGPVVVPVEPAPAVAPASSISAGIVIPLLLLIALAAAVSSNSNNAPAQ